MAKKKRAGVRFNEELYINFIYNPDTETVDVYKNGILISSGGGGGVTPEQLYEILQGYVSKPELTEALGGYVTSVDLTTALSDYVTTSQLATALSDYITSGALQTVLSDYATKAELEDYATKTELEDYVQFTDYADDEYYGLIKTNSSENVYLDENGNIIVGGRLGQTELGGLYYPLTIEPEQVSKNSLLLTEGTKVSVNNKRIFGLVAGTNVNIKAGKEAGSTKFEISNTFGNRFICAIARNGYATINEDTAGDLMVHVTAVYLANDPDKTPLVPYSGASESRNNIIIETDAPLSETESISTLRLYGSMTFDSCLHIGQGNGTGGVTGKGKLLQVGQNQLALEGNNALIGNGIFTNTNRNIIVGAYHICTLVGSCLTGTGHDTSNGSKNGITAHGEYSEISEKTVFALGNGTNNTTRSNIFEIIDDNGVTGIILKSPNGTKHEFKADDNGGLSGLATQAELQNVENEIPDISGLATKTELQAVENEIPIYEIGNENIGNVPANSYIDQPITFTKTFNNAPEVFLTLNSASTGAGMGNVTISAINVNTSGFTIRVFNNDSTQRTPNVRWLAIL